MEWVVIVLACIGVAALVVWFVGARKHPETASTHVGRSGPERPTNQADPWRVDPQGPTPRTCRPTRDLTGPERRLPQALRRRSRCRTHAKRAGGAATGSSQRGEEHLGAAQVIGVDLVPERLERARVRGTKVLDVRDFDDDQDSIAAAIKEVAGRGGPDAVGMEAHGSGGAKLAQAMTDLLPRRVAEKLMERAGIDRLAALLLAIESVRRGGTLSLAGVYGGMTDPLPMMTMFDKQLTIRMGQANVKRWIDDILPLLTDEDVLGVDDFATHRLPLADAPLAYEQFQKKQDGAIKVLFQPTA